MDYIFFIAAVIVLWAVLAYAIYALITAIEQKIFPTSTNAVSGTITKVGNNQLSLKAKGLGAYKFNIENTRIFSHGFELKKGAQATVYYSGGQGKRAQVVNATLTNGEKVKYVNEFKQPEIVYFNDFNIPAKYEIAAAAKKAKESSSEIPKQTAWLGDEISFPITLFTSDKAIENAKATVTVTDENGEKLNWETSCRFIDETLAYAGNCTADKNTVKVKQSIPDVLFSQECSLVEANSLKNIWVSVKVPSDARACAYNAVIEIASSDCELIKSEFSFDVQALKLPAPSDYDFDIELWQYPYRLAQYYNLEPFGNEHKELLKKHMRKYKEMGGTAITASIVEEPWNKQTYGDYPSMIKWTLETDGKFSFTFDDFDAWVELCDEVGVNKKIVCYSLIPWGNKITYFDKQKGQLDSTSPKPGTKEYEAVWTQFLEALAKHADEKGWFEKIYIGIDERPKMELAFDVIEKVKGKNGECFKISAAMDHFSSKFFPIIDRISSISVGSFAVKKAPDDYKQLTKRRNGNSNLKTTIYTCTGHFPNSFTYSLPFEGYHTMMYCASMSTTGFLRWALDAWVENPLEDTTFKSFEAGDCFLVYPDKADSKEMETKSSVRLEMLLKGLRDVNKLLYLSKQGEEWKEKCDLILKDVKPTYAFSGAGIAKVSTCKELPSDMIKIIEKINEIGKEFLSAE